MGDFGDPSIVVITPSIFVIVNNNYLVVLNWCDLKTKHQIMLTVDNASDYAYCWQRIRSCLLLTTYQIMLTVDNASDHAYCWQRIGSCLLLTTHQIMLTVDNDKNVEYNDFIGRSPKWPMNHNDWLHMS